MQNFTYAGQLNGAENPIVRDVLIKNSESLEMNTAVVLDGANGLIPATAGSKILGIVIGFYKNGIPVQNYKSADLSGTWVESTGIYTASSTNITVEGVRAKLICDKDALFKNDANADMTPVMEGMHFNLVDATQIDGDTNVAAAGQMELIKVDPDDASIGTFCICESLRDAYVQQ